MMFLPISIFVAVWISAHAGCPFLSHDMLHGELVYEDESDRNLSMAPNRYLLNFKCEEGYTLLGLDYVYCEGYRWSSVFPECSMLNCPKPPHVEHSRIEILKGTIQNPIVGSKTIYTCEEGYILNENDKSLTCILEENTARWDVAPPSCLASCPDPGRPYHGHRRGHCCSIGAQLTYHCRKGYDLIGHESINCGSNGKWSAPRPLCKPRNIEVCPLPPTIEHGTVQLSTGQKTGDYYFVYEEVEVVCDPGFAFYGKNKYVFCQRNLQWDVAFGECRESYCPRPNIPGNGSIIELENNTATEFPHNFELTYVCNDGYKLFVDNARQCNKGKWTGKEPICEKIHCYEPPSPEDGNKIGDDFSVGALVKFHCFSGYELLGSVERYCLPNGQWSGELARCNLKSNYCPNPGVPIKGKKIGESYDEGDEVSFACEGGFKLIGSAIRKCLPDHTWSGNEAVCLGTHDFDSERKVGNILRSSMEERAEEQATKTKTFEMELNDTKNTPMDKRTLDLTFPDRYVLYFLFDTSGSVREANFNASIRFAKALVKKIGIAPNGARVGAVTFSSKVNIQFYPIHYRTTKEVLDALDVIKYEKGGTTTGTALEVVRKVMIPIVKRNIGVDAQLKTVIFLMTDGKANTGGNPKEQGDLLKDEGAEIYCIGITGDIRKNELYDLASEPLEEHVFILKNYLIMDWLIQELTSGEIDFSTCGLASNIRYQPRIIRGKIVREPWPWMVALYFTKSKSKFEPELKCGASIINQQWLLTAAHCLVEEKEEKIKRTSDVVIKLGLTHVENVTNLQEFEAESFHIHPQYDESTVDYDIALMKLSGSIKYTRYVRPVCLPPKDIPEDSILYKPGRMAFVTGWGHDEPVPIGRRRDGNFGTVPHLKELAMPIQERSTCADSMADHGLLKRRFTNRMFCAGDGQGKVDTCVGDGGGPLMQQQLTNDDGDTYWTQVGIVSWGMGCGQPNTYGTYTHVHRQLQWIYDTINDYQDEN